MKFLYDLYQETFDLVWKNSILDFNGCLLLSWMQVALFVVLGMILRRKPDVLICLLPILKETQKCVGQDRLPVAVWVIAQVYLG